MKSKFVIFRHFVLGLFLWTLILLALFCTIIIPPLVTTKLGLSAFKAGDFKSAANYWQQTNRIVAPLAGVTRPLFTDGVVWSTGLMLGENLANDLLSLQQEKSSYYDLPTDILLAHLSDYLLQLDTLETSLSSSRIIRPLLSRYQIADSIVFAKNWIKTLTPILNQRTKWIVLLQNDNELRATGGFMGSYALVTLNRGKIEDISIEDIYDADGQFKGYFAAPSGVKEYLSSGNGLRLPDANWHPDFPSSAQQVLSYFALGKRQEITAVVAITNSLIGEILQITGPIWLPDYQTSLTADTIDSVLQNRPQEFFPGSIQKKHLLSQAKNQLINSVINLKIADWQKLLLLLKKEIGNNNILFYSLDESVNSLFETYHMNGRLNTQKDNQEVLKIVESNVGINKSNQWQHRTVTLDLTQIEQPSITINFSNQAPTSVVIDQARYANYLRLITDLSWKLQTVKIDSDVTTEKWQQDELQTVAGDEFLHAGGLIEIAPNTSKSITFVFQRSQNQHQSLLILKQTGLPATHYTVLLPNGTKEEFILENRHEVWY